MKHMGGRPHLPHLWASGTTSERASEGKGEAFPTGLASAAVSKGGGLLSFFYRASGIVYSLGWF